MKMKWLEVVQCINYTHLIKFNLRLSEGNDMKNIPNDVKAEQAILGCMLFNNDSIDVVSARLTPDDFYTPVKDRKSTRLNSSHRT